MKGSCWFNSLDLKAGYWQIEISECDEAKTASVLPPPFGLWECNRMPFGLCNAPSTFQRAMEKCLGELNHICCVAYLDDIIVFGRTLDEHIERLEKVIDRLASHGFKMEPSKCGLLQRKVQYLVDNLLDPQHIDPQFVRERKEGQKAKQKEHYDKCAPCGDCLEAIIRHIILSSVR